MNRAERQQRNLAMANDYRSGMTRQELADKYGVAITYISQIFSRMGVHCTEGGRFLKARAIRNQRASEMVAQYKSGMTLVEIGEKHGVTRERARQLIKGAGVTGRQGGQSVITKRKRKIRDAKRDLNYLARHGCTYDEYKKIQRFGRATEIGSPIFCYMRQKANAAYRGIKWEISLTEWWAVWRASGKWDKRGTGDGYCMSRIGDTGPYSVDNVRIVHNVSNVIEHYTLTNNKPYTETLEKWGLVA